MPRFLTLFNTSFLCDSFRSSQLFADWDYIAPSAIKNELDILDRGRLRTMSDTNTNITN